MIKPVKQIVLWCTVLQCSLVLNQVQAQLVSASLSKEKMLLGEQVELVLKVEHIGRNNLDVTKWFNLPDTFNHLEVVQRSAIDTLQNENGFTYKQSILITGFDSGYWSIPTLQVQLSNNQFATTSQIGITILPVDISNMTAYHDVKDILPVKLQTSWKIILALALTVIISFFGLLWALSFRKANKTIQQQKIYTGTAYEQAMQQLAALQQQNLLTLNQHKLYFNQLIAICKQFGDTTMHTKTQEKTLDEYMIGLKGLVGNEQTQSAYFQLLRLTSVVKYAQYIPPIEECHEAMTIAKQFVQTVHQYYLTHA